MRHVLFCTLVQLKKALLGLKRFACWSKLYHMFNNAQQIPLYENLYLFPVCGMLCTFVHEPAARYTSMCMQVNINIMLELMVLIGH